MKSIIVQKATLSFKIDYYKMSMKSVNEQFEWLMRSMVEKHECAQENIESEFRRVIRVTVNSCATMYGFSAEEALKRLNSSGEINEVPVLPIQKKEAEKAEKAEKLRLKEAEKLAKEAEKAEKLRLKEAEKAEKESEKALKEAEKTKKLKDKEFEKIEALRRKEYENSKGDKILNVDKDELKIKNSKGEIYTYKRIEK
jgi:sRNA-binding protein